jgi:hypothetical protein
VALATLIRRELARPAQPIALDFEGLPRTGEELTALLPQRVTR